MRILFTSLLFLLVAPTSQAQYALKSSTTDTASTGTTQFLWFTGHWANKSKTKFVVSGSKGTTQPGGIGGGAPTGDGSGGDDGTTAPGVGTAGGTVTITPDGQVQVQSGSNDAWNKKLDNGLNDLQKEEDQLTAPANDMQPIAHHLNEALKPQLDTLKAQFTDFKIEDNTDLLNPEKQGLSNVKSAMSDWCTKTKARYDEILAYYKAHKADKEPEYQSQNPKPPELDYTCVGCDTTSQKVFDKQVDAYVDAFFKPEQDMIKDALGMMRSLVLVGRSNDIDGSSSNVSMSSGMSDIVDQLFKGNKADPSKSGPCAYFDSYTLSKAVKFLALHAYLRAMQLVKDNKKNFKACRPVCLVAMTASRQAQLMGYTVSDNDYYTTLKQMVSDSYYYYKNKLVKDHDWSQLGNIPFIISLYRQYALLGGGDNLDQTTTTDQNGQHTKEGLQEMMSIMNHFYMILEMDEKIGKDGGYLISHVKTDTIKIAPDLDFANNKCYTWVAIEDNPNSLGIAVRKTNQLIDFNMVDNEMIFKGDRAQYVGTKHFDNLLQWLKMDFCHPGYDTLLLTSIVANPQGLTGFIYKGSVVGVAGLAAGDQFFRSLSDEKALVNSGKVQEQSATNQAEGQQMIAQLRSMKAEMDAAPADQKAAKYHEMMDLVQKVKDLNNNKNVSPMLFVPFAITPQNNTAKIFHKVYDAKEINPQLSEAIVYGRYTVDIGYSK